MQKARSALSRQNDATNRWQFFAVSAQAKVLTADEARRIAVNMRGCPNC
jgi:hypothetical protein